MEAANINLRHLRAFCEVAHHKSISAASGVVFLSQPAITQALAKLEKNLEVSLFERRSEGMYITEPGTLFLNRAERALNNIQQGTRLAVKGSGKGNTGTTWQFDKLLTIVQLRALLAVSNARNFSLAARNINVSQPTLYRTARELERLSGMELYKKVAQGIELTSAAKILAQYAALAFYELNQGLEEIRVWRGFDAGKIVVGTMPLARTYILPKAINELSRLQPDVMVNVIDGPYEDLLDRLRHGQIDVLMGALRDPAPVDDVVQEKLLSDPLIIVGRTGHPLADKTTVSVSDLAEFSWVAPRPGTPTRSHFENVFKAENAAVPTRLVESSSLILILGLLLNSDRLTMISEHQVMNERAGGRLTKLAFEMAETARPIGMTVRKDWQPTATQNTLLNLLRQASLSAV